MKNAFQANAKYQVNGFDIAMLSEPATGKLRVRTQNIENGNIIDEQVFDYSDPADVSAAFAKFSMSVTFAVAVSPNAERAGGE